MHSFIVGPSVADLVVKSQNFARVCMYTNIRFSWLVGLVKLDVGIRIVPTIDVKSSIYTTLARGLNGAIQYEIRICIY